MNPGRYGYRRVAALTELCGCNIAVRVDAAATFASMTGYPLTPDWKITTTSAACLRSVTSSSSTMR
jgi:hypothetical protein